jgi:hypothetical protein
MKTSILFLANLLFLSFFASTSFAGDIYAEYKMTGVGGKPITTKMYSKNGDLRTEANVEMGGQKMTTTTLMLKSKPNVTLVFNYMSKTYTETKNASGVAVKNFDIKVIGSEKVGNYNCTHVKMSANGQSWDMWYAKDLPAINFPLSGQDAAATQKMIAQLKNKGITGMPVKITFAQPGNTSAAVTMLLSKFEQKNLSASLFTIPAGYKKNSMSFDAEKMKTMSPQQRKEMVMKMMKEQMKQ